MMTDVERAEFAAFLNQIPRNMFAITLRYREGPVPIDKMRRDLRDLHARVDRKVLGRDFHKAPSSTRSSYWAIAEQVADNPHVHCGWQFPSLGHGLVLIDLLNQGEWESRYAPGGTHDHQPYDKAAYAHGDGWAGYALKATYDSDHIILSDQLNIAKSNL